MADGIASTKTDPIYRRFACSTRPANEVAAGFASLFMAGGDKEDAALLSSERRKGSERFIARIVLTRSCSTHAAVLFVIKSRRLWFQLTHCRQERFYLGRFVEVFSERYTAEVHRR